MDTIISFIRDRLEADRQLAIEAKGMSQGTWTTGSLYAVVDDRDDIVVYDEGSPDEYQARHIATHDPARTRLEVEAKLLLLDVAQTFLTAGLDDGCDILRALALPFAEHVEYQEGWRPEGAVS